MAKQFGIIVPKRFDSKTKMREHFQSRDFLIQLKSKMNQLYYQAINEANGLPDLLSAIQKNQSQNPQISQKFYIGKGNNEAVVRSVIKQRYWWVNNQDEDFNEVSFMWTQWKKQKHIDYLNKRGGGVINNSLNEKAMKIYNKMEQNKQLTNKKGMFLNMREYYQLMKKDPFQILPLTFLVKEGQNDEEFKKFQGYFNDFQSQAKQIEMKREQALKKRYEELEQIKQSNLCKSKQKIKTSSFLPKVNVKRNYQEEEYSDVEDSGGYAGMDIGYEYEDDEEESLQSERSAMESDSIIQEIKRKYRVPKNVWIIKPGENTNRGNGINVSSNFNEIKSLIQKSGVKGKERTYIIQKYIDYPLLINNRKFDFRCYGVLSSINGYQKGYFYEDAYIRTSCKEYDIENLHNKFIHLTNDAVQKRSDDYGKYENGNKMSLQDFQKYLKQEFPQMKINFFKHILPQIRRLVTDTFRAAYGKIDPQKLNNTFEIFGYDFMLDQDFKLYLIEVNTNPCLEISSPLLARIIPELLDNVFRIILDPIFPSPDFNNFRKCQGNEIPQEIKFTLVFDEIIDAPEIQSLRSNDSNIIKEEIESDNEEVLAQEEELNNMEQQNQGY